MIKEEVNKFYQWIINSGNNYGFIFYGSLIILVIVFLLTTTLTAYVKNKKLEQHYYRLISEIEQTKKSNEAIREECWALRNDPVYLEMKIRRTLRMMREGEFVIEDTQ